jgi:hypothetical protein
MKKFSLIIFLSIFFLVNITLAESDLPAYFESIELTNNDTQTLITLTVKTTKSYGYAIYIDPIKESVIRDNLGNEYKPLGLKDEEDKLTGKIGGGKLLTQQRSGTLIFPAIKPETKSISFILPIKKYQTLFGNNGTYNLIKIWNLDQESNLLNNQN